MRNEVSEKLQKCLCSVREKTDFVPQVAIVLGSGLGDYADGIQVEAEIDYKEIEGFPVSTVPGHAGKFIFGYVGTVPVVCMKGRVHYYEGYPISDVVLPTRLMQLLGAKILFLTNASGGINPAFHAGSDADHRSYRDFCTESADRTKFRAGCQIPGYESCI